MTHHLNHTFLLHKACTNVTLPGSCHSRGVGGGIRREGGRERERKGGREGGRKGGREDVEEGVRGRNKQREECMDEGRG